MTRLARGLGIDGFSTCPSIAGGMYDRALEESNPTEVKDLCREIIAAAG